MAKSFKFTDAAIKKRCLDVASGNELPAEYQDEGSQVGLRLRIGSRGGVFYSVRRVGGRVARTRIGTAATMTVKTARDRATKLAAGVEAAAARPVRTTGNAIRCQDAFDAYLAAALDGTFRKGHKAVAESTAKSYVELWNPHCKRTYGQRSLLHLANDIEAIHAKFNKHGKVAARPAAQKRMMQVLKNLFEYAMRQGWWKDKNPLLDEATGKPIACEGTQDRERFLSDGELKAWVEWAENEEEPWPDYFRLLLLTGIRKSTLCAMAWKDIDIKSKQPAWRLSSEQTKNKDPLVVPLVDDAVSVLKRRLKYRPKGCKWVFPSRPDNGVASKSGHIEEPGHAWDRMKEETGLDDIRIHDIRRTAGTMAAKANKHSLPEVARFLGQRTLRAVAIYARAGEHEAREVGATIEAALRQAEE